MARKPNYRHERRTREIQKQEKKAAKAEAKRQKTEEARSDEDAEPGPTEEN